MKTKTAAVKIVLDISMTILMFMCMSFQFTEQENHELFGTILFVAFILHHVLNWRWYASLRKGRFTATRILLTVIDFAMLMDMLILMLSGMRISGYIFKFVKFGLEMETARSLHMRASYGGFLILGLHVGLHYRMILNQLKRTGILKAEGGIQTLCARLLALGFSVYGIVVTFQRSFWDYILGRVHFVMFDYGESLLKFEFDLFAVLVLMAAIGYYLQRLLTKKQK